MVAAAFEYAVAEHWPKFRTKGYQCRPVRLIEVDKESSNEKELCG